MNELMKELDAAAIVMAILLLIYFLQLAREKGKLVQVLCVAFFVLAVVYFAAWLMPDCIPMTGGGCSFTLGTMG